MRSCAILSALIVTSGCASHAQSTYEYTVPKEIEIGNDVYLEKPFEEVWDKLVKELVKSFYVINNIEKESRIINLSFSTDHPEEFVDCGRSLRTFKHGKTELTYDYPFAGSNSYKLAGGRVGEFANFQVISIVHRKSSLEGRANIYVAPEDTGTRVTVNCRYMYKVSTSGVAQAFNYAGGIVVQETLPPGSFDATFNTNQFVSVNWGEPGKCQSTGKLENEILGMVPK